jgi:hypothetical protein
VRPVQRCEDQPLRLVGGEMLTPGSPLPMRGTFMTSGGAPSGPVARQTTPKPQVWSASTIRKPSAIDPGPIWGACTPKENRPIPLSGLRRL